MIVLRQRPLVPALALLLGITLGLLLLAAHRHTRYLASFSDAFSAFPVVSTSSLPKTTPPAHGTPQIPLTNPQGDVGRVGNGSLGFARVFVVGLPERSDKRDALVLGAAVTGFGVEWVDGVRGETVVDKAVPVGVEREKLWENNLGSWRGHMNAVRRIVEENLESALIMEDDMDWDVHLKAQLEHTAAGARYVSAHTAGAFPATVFESPTRSRAQPATATPSSQYGDDWDILWLGHCGEPFPETLDEHRSLPADDPARALMATKYTIANDSTVPPLEHLTGQVDFVDYPPHTRWVHVTGAPICSFAYALSQRGARRVLFDLSVDGLSGPFDVALSALCRRAVGSWPQLAREEWPPEDLEGISKGNGDLGLGTRCLSVNPPLFFSHRAKGSVAGDSDIQSVDDGRVREKGSTENIVWSARNNIRNVLLGLPLERQF